MSTQDKTLREAITLGEEAKIFLNSDLAKYICNSAEALSEAALMKLKTVDAQDTKEINRLQNEIAKFDHFNNSLIEIVSAGDTAYQLYLAELGD